MRHFQKGGAQENRLTCLTQYPPLSTLNLAICHKDASQTLLLSSTMHDLGSPIDSKKCFIISNVPVRR